MQIRQKASELLQLFNQELTLTYSVNESTSIAYIVFEELFNLSRTDFIIDTEFAFTVQDQAKLDKTIARLKQQEPIQYILGTTEFFGRPFKVRKDVLIPRPETEELVDLIIKKSKGNERILDIGTGSGCIPISLKLELPSTNVFALDISDLALEIAQENALSLSADISFFQSNILRDELEMEPFDLIISNPPYVCDSEKRLMNNNVLNYEPHLALFVSDDDPLIFYKRIVDLSSRYLNKGGYLYFEINESLGQEIICLLENSGFDNCTLLKDLNSKDRMVYGIRN